MDNQNVNSLITGLSQGINKYLDLGVEFGLKQKQEASKQSMELEKGKQLEANKVQLNLNKDQTMALYKQTLEGKIDPDTAANIHPAAAKMVENFHTKNGRLPTVAEFDRLADDLSKIDNKTQKADDVRLTQWNRALSSDREFTNSRTKRDNLENVGALIQQVSSQPDGPDKRQLYEQAVAQMRVLAGNGQISEKEIAELVPHTWRGTAAKYLEYIVNKPEGTEAQDFIKRSQDFFDRESKVTKDQMERRFKQLSGPYSDILKRNKGPASETYTEYSVNHPDYNPVKDIATEAPKAEEKSNETIHTYPSGKKAIFKDGRWQPYNG